MSSINHHVGTLIVLITFSILNQVESSVRGVAVQCRQSGGAGGVAEVLLARPHEMERLDNLPNLRGGDHGHEAKTAGHPVAIDPL